MTQIPMTVSAIAPSSSIAPSSAIERLSVLAEKTFALIQARIPLATVIPAIGQTVTVSITPIAGVSTAAAFPSGDLVVLDQVLNGATTQRATFVIDAAPVGTNLVLRYQPVAGDAPAGATLLANTEITGQTRLPAAPSGATWAFIQMQASEAILGASKSAASNPLNPVATNLLEGEPLAYLNYAVAGTLPTDLILHTGIHLGWLGHETIGNAVDIQNARLFCTCPMALAPRCVVTYR